LKDQKREKNIRVRVFRAPDDVESCRRFAEGHANVLRDYGVTKVTSAKNDWFYNPGVFVIIVESEDGKHTYGGERVHIANDTQPLPIEEAIGIVDTKIYPLVAEYAKNKTGELCGLWNSKDIAGHGLSILLTRMGVTLARMLDMGSLFVLCAPYTVAMAKTYGFVIETSIGKEGTFYYPKLDLVATSLVINDVPLLSTAAEEQRQEVVNLLNKPIQQIFAEGPKGKACVNIDLTLKRAAAK